VVPEALHPKFLKWFIRNHILQMKFEKNGKNNPNPVQECEKRVFAKQSHLAERRQDRIFSDRIFFHSIRPRGHKNKQLLV
jgi:hypothetical protein